MTADDGAALRVVSWNVRSLRDDTAALTAALRRLGPDLVCLQEAPRFLRWRHALADLARRSGLLVVCGGATTGGPALLAALRVDVRSTYEWRLPRTRGLHQRGVAAAALRVGRRPVLVASIHLGLDPAERQRHADLLLRRLTGLPGPLVLAGDLNETEQGPAWRLLTGQRLRDAWRVAPRGGEATFPAVAPRRRIDAVLVDADVRVLGAGVPSELDAGLYAAASDHRPVLADLRLPG